MELKDWTIIKDDKIYEIIKGATENQIELYCKFLETIENNEIPPVNKLPTIIEYKILSIVEPIEFCTSSMRMITQRLEELLSKDSMDKRKKRRGISIYFRNISDSNIVFHGFSSKLLYDRVVAYLNDIYLEHRDKDETLHRFFSRVSIFMSDCKLQSV